MRLIQHDHVVKELAPAAAHPPFRYSVLPRAPEAGPHRTHLHVPEHAINFSREDGVAIQQQVLRATLERERLAQLLSDPGRCGMGRHVQVQYLTPIMPDDEEHVEERKGQCREVQKSMAASTSRCDCNRSERL